jgi:hypothetical protein
MPYTSRKYIRWSNGTNRIVAEIPAPRIINRGISTRNSRIELIKQDNAVLKVNISRGIKIFVTRLGLPTMENMAAVVPLAKKRHARMPVNKYKTKFSWE